MEAGKSAFSNRTTEKMLGEDGGDGWRTAFLRQALDAVAEKAADSAV